VLNGKTAVVDSVNKSIGSGYGAIATGDAFVSSSLILGDKPPLRPTLSLELVKRALVKPSAQAIAEWEKSGGAAAAPIPNTKSLITETNIDGQTYTLAVSPILNAAGQPIAALIRGTSHETLKALLFSTSILVLSIGVVAIGIGFLLARSISKAIAQSIQSLEGAAQQYTAGNFTIKAEVDSGDEIGALATVFNQMIDTIRTRATEQAHVKAQVEMQGQLLEDEVGHLLDVVSDLEGGNLTIQAAVSDQATGLVADTLNRLIEQLVTTISSVFNTAQQVTQGAETLENLATSVAENAESQAQSVTQATDRIDNINQLATNASAEAIAADVAVQSAQNAVNQGQQEITKLTSSIILLQQGTAQIVQRLITLGEFVDLAKQFVQDQKRLSSLTQVVAMNASMIAARATEQREPDQFASVAREFEAIASQVNNLAAQTNQGLIVLQQRTGFIEIVVSGINQDVKDVSDSVNEFTIGVEQSSQAFNDIKNVTEQVAQLGRTVAESSQAIATAVKSSFASIQEISTLAAKSANQAGFTRQQSVEMGQLARRLLHDVHFFQLPPDKMSQNLPVLKSDQP
jgi:methyl-accepting chemotaxis protein PixJ